MVIHDETRVQVWAQEQEQQKQKREKPRQRMHLSVWAVQSIACCVVLLVVLLLRVAGGEAYASLRQRFQQALARNEWATALSLIWDDNPLEMGETADDRGVKVTDLTAEEAARQTDA